LDCKELESGILDIEELSSFVHTIEEVDKKFAALGDLLLAENTVDLLITEVGQYQSLEQEWNELGNMASMVNKTLAAIQESSHIIDEITDEMIKLAGQAGVCPLCGNDSIDAEDHILEWING